MKSDINITNLLKGSLALTAPVMGISLILQKTSKEGFIPVTFKNFVKLLGSTAAAMILYEYMYERSKKKDIPSLGPAPKHGV